jgi:hypothetical protein
MFRLFVILIPTLTAVGCTALVSKIPQRGHDQDRSMRLTAGAFAIGIFFSSITWWQQTTMADQIAQANRAAGSQKATLSWDKAEDKGYEEKINTLTAQVASLREQLAKLGGTPQPAVVPTTVKQQNSELPKIYWTQGDAGAGASAVRFKIYGPLNIPAFAAICDRPCRATGGQIGSGSDGVQVVGATNKIAGYIFRKPRPIQAGTSGFIVIEPVSAKVTEFKILDLSEIPEGMR